MAITVEEYKITQKNIDDKVFFKESKGNNRERGDGYEDGEFYYDDGYSGPNYDRTPKRKEEGARSKYMKGLTSKYGNTVTN